MKTLLSLLFQFYLFQFYSQPLNSWSDDKIMVRKASEVSTIMNAEMIFTERWDILPQPQFWKQIMLLSPDSCLINIAATRVVLKKMSNKDWNSQSELEKDSVRQNLRKEFGLSNSDRIYVTTGKNDFFKFKEVYPSLSKGVAAFEKFGVDPWYAQAILLIESPGQLKKSISGAYGAFQLMPNVARAQGLTVNNTLDERANFERCAYGSARLIQKNCIPEAKNILAPYSLKYNETDLWFRLFVMHVYHAGAGNVAAVIAKIQPKIASKQIILDMWQNTGGGFGNNSQNYTQLALAAQLIIHDMIYKECDEISDCTSR